MESGFAYGYRNITLDMKDHGENLRQEPRRMF
jgi:hypothetical protein